MSDLERAAKELGIEISDDPTTFDAAPTEEPTQAVEEDVQEDVQEQVQEPV